MTEPVPEWVSTSQGLGETCGWPINYGPCSVPERYLQLDPADRALFEDAAANYLWRWTGRELGLCPVEISPCLESCPIGWSTYEGASGHYSVSAYAPGSTRAITVCECSTCYGLPRLSVVQLPGRVHSVDSVSIDGALLPPASYTLLGTSLLARVDGGAWPLSGSGWIVSYLQGKLVPVGGQVAAARLAVELWKASCGDSSCGLPQRVQTVTRQGVSVAVLDSFDDIDTGHTGIWVIDSWVASMTRPPARPYVLTPELLRERRGSMSPTRFGSVS